jgi:hypothetical protein
MQTLLFPVGEAGAIFLLISPSPTMNGMGGVGVSVPSNDNFSTHYNPANYIAPKGFLSFQTSIERRVDWLPGFNLDDMYLDYDIFTLGYRLKKYPVQLSLTKSQLYLSLGEQFRVDEVGNILGSFTSYMEADAITYSIAYSSEKYPFYFSIGRTDKTANQHLSDLGAGAEMGKGYSIDSFYDWGYLLSFPSVFKTNNKDINLSFTPSIGYSKSNIGGLIYFIDPAQADPAPRTARFGISGIFEAKDKSDQTLLKFTFVREAEDLLIKGSLDSLVDSYTEQISSFWNWEYQKGLGDINIEKHILSSILDEDVIIHRGFEISIYDAFSIREGIYIDEEGRINVKSNGYGFNLKGFLKALSIFIDPPFPELTKYFNVSYSYSKWNETPGHPIDNTKYKGYTISFTHLDELIKGILK